MPITRKALKAIVMEAVEDVTDSVVEEEVDEIADIVSDKLRDECPELWDVLEDDEAEEAGGDGED